MGYSKLSLVRFKRKLAADDSLTIEDKGAFFDAMCKIICYAQSHKLKLMWSARAKAIFWYEHNTITISSAGSPIRMVHDLLHELGHHKLVRVRRFKNNAGDESKTVPHILNALNEEFEAWHQGRIISRSFGICINEEMYSRSEHRSLMNYVKWAARRGSKEKRWV